MVTITQFEKYYTNKKTKRNVYYQEYAQRYMKNKKAIKWNWPAALFGGYWLIHRKSYRGLAIYLLIFFTFLAFCGSLLKWLPQVFSQARDIPHPELFALLTYFIIPGIFRGIYGNNLYFWDLKKRIAKNSTATGTDNIFITFLLYNLGPFIILIVISALLVFINDLCFSLFGIRLIPLSY